MSLALVLFLLRVITAAILLGIVLVVFLALWRDHQTVVQQAGSARRVYGQLIAVEQHDGQTHETGETYPLLPLTSLGRAPTNTILIDDSFASSEHARVILKEGQWWLEDRQSRNGTFLNGVLIGQPVVMTDGDVIGIGQKRFRIEFKP